MKKSLIVFLGLSVFAFPATIVFAASRPVLTNGGLGQVAANPDSFGVAVCNGGTQTLTQSVPVSVTTNGQTASVSSAASIKAGGCEYSYLAYSQLGMQAGGTYSVTVTIDSKDKATYDITIPSSPVAVAPVATPVQATANVSDQSGNFFSTIFNWFANLFK